MRQHYLKPTLLALTALAMTGLAPMAVSAQDRPDDHHAMRADDHRDDHRDDRHSDDSADRYRHDHPHSSARCHDGFFTSTRDRNRACSKHGGIDVWLSL
jgi:ABC-type Zn2+ transport system substrate-binding protein/surface adhesin